MTSRSPIESRLALLYEQWETFATDREARVLRWLIRDDERRMLEALLPLEDDEHGQLAVLFFVLDTPFERGRYGHDLRHDLEQQLVAMGEDFAAAARSPSGVTSEATVSDIGLLMQTCSGLVRHIDDAVEMIALVLWPKAVGEPKSFAEWLHRAARVVPPRVRLVVVDGVEAPLLDSLDGPHVRCVTANLDMRGALEELAANAPGHESAGGRFREAFVAMSTALSRGEIDLAREQAADASREGTARSRGGAVWRRGLGSGGAGVRDRWCLGWREARFRDPGRRTADGGVVMGTRRRARAGMGHGAGRARRRRGDDRRGARTIDRSVVGELLLRLSADGARFETERERVALRLAQLLGSGWRR